MKQKRKRGKKNKKSTARTKTILFVIGIFLCLGFLLLFESGIPLIVESYIATLGMILAFPTMKEEYDDYQNGRHQELRLSAFWDIARLQFSV